MENGTVLGCLHYTDNPKRKSGTPRTVKDYEADLYLNDERSMVLDGVEYKLQRGDVAIRRPGQIVQGIGGNINCYCLTVSFDRETTAGGDPMCYTRMCARRPVQKAEPSPLFACLPSLIRPKHPEYVIELFETLAQLSMDLSVPMDAKWRLCEKILYLLASEAIEAPTIHQPAKTELMAAQLKIRKRYASEVSIAELARECGFSQGYLIRCFKREYGCTPSEYLLRVRMENAGNLLVLTDNTVSEIARQCGYQTQSFFCTMFRKYYGVSPREFRDKNHG